MNTFIPPAWLAKAIEQKNPRVSLAVAMSYELKITSWDWILVKNNRWN
jgi:hypothetical protein